MKKLLKEFYEDCVNFTNVEGLIIFTLLPRVFTGKWEYSIYWGGAYLSSLIIMWVLIRKGIIKDGKKNR